MKSYGYPGKSQTFYNVLGTIFIILLAILFTISSKAQSSEFVFKVLVSKGKNKVNNEPIKVGTGLVNKDSIEIGENSYLGLVHFSGEPLEVKEPGKYIVRDLEKRIHPDFTYSFPPKKTRLSAVGPVSSPKMIHTFSDGGYNTIISPVTIFWCPDKELKLPDQFTYRVSTETLIGDPLVSYETKKNFITVDLRDQTFQREDIIVIRIAMMSENKTMHKSQSFALKKITQSDKIKFGLEELETRMESSAEDHNFWNTLGEDCKAKKLYINAAHAFYKAYLLSKDPEYKNKIKDLLNDDAFLTCHD